MEKTNAYNSLLISLLAKNIKNLMFNELSNPKSSISLNSETNQEFRQEYLEALESLKKLDLRLNLASLTQFLGGKESNIKQLLKDLNIRPLPSWSKVYKLNDILNKMFKINVFIDTKNSGFIYKKKSLREIDLGINAQCLAKLI